MGLVRLAVFDVKRTERAFWDEATQKHDHSKKLQVPGCKTDLGLILTEHQMPLAFLGINLVLCIARRSSFARLNHMVCVSNYDC